jgi:hypothetical protein
MRSVELINRIANVLGYALIAFWAIVPVLLVAVWLL